jgi:hypothetical protein
MKLLELFKGTGSIGKIFKQLYPDGQIVSVDILKKYEPSYCCDILDFDYKQFSIGHFDIIWASPECKVFSKLQHTWLKTSRGDKGKWDDMEHLNRVRNENGKYVKKVLEIIDYLKPTFWFIENPWESAMIKLDFMKDLPNYRFDYCRFDYDYKKPTRIWTNKSFENIICNHKNKPHKYRPGIGKGSKFMYNTPSGDLSNINQRYSIPPKLILHLLQNGEN